MEASDEFLHLVGAALAVQIKLDLDSDRLFFILVPVALLFAIPLLLFLPLHHKETN